MNQSFKKAMQKELKKVDINLSMDSIPKIFDAFKNAITELTLKDEKIKIQSFFRIELKERAEGEKRNPQTGKTIHVPTKFYPKLTFSTKFKDQFNEEYQEQTKK